jgi:hypothetical protein
MATATRSKHRERSWRGRLAAGVLLLGTTATAVQAEAARDDVENDARQSSAPTAEAPARRSLNEIFLDMVNPYGSVFSVFNHLEYRDYQGDLGDADSRNRLRWDIVGSWPFLLDDGRRIVVRLNVPINFGEPTYPVDDREYAEWGIRQDADLLPNDRIWFNGHSFLDEPAWDVSWGGTSEEGWITGIGLAGVLPWGKDGSIERDQYLLGPDFVLGKVSDWGILGGRLRHLTNIADVQSAKEFITWDTNLTELHWFFAYPMNNGWNLIANPKWVYDWEGASDNRLLLPIGGGVSKMYRWFGMPVKMDLELEYYAATPEAFGPQWLARFSLSPAVIDRWRP